MNTSAEDWVKTTFASMTTEEKVAQLMHPEDRGYSLSDWEQILDRVPLGSIFLGKKKAADLEATTRFIQAHSKVPVLISADMEHGACMIEDKSAKFPFPMSLGACDDPELAYRTGRITARECRCRGIHWTFSPISDLNINPNNPITNIRSLGDNPDKTIPLLNALIRGIQEDCLMAATSKHFPGDGVDDRDQHMVTSVNSLPFDQYLELYGRVWKSVIHEAGVRCIMAGHISLPDYQGCQEDVDLALPATLSRKLQIDLLRKEFGFQGVLVSDAFPMIGFTSRYLPQELAWRNIESGSDSVLFCHPFRDFKNLMDALRDGRLSEERVNESCLRILRLKAELKLHQDCFGTVPSPEEYEENRKVGVKVAEKSVTQIRERPGLLPLDAKKLKKVLTVTLQRADCFYNDVDLTVIDAELKKRGMEVDHLVNPGHRELIAALKNYDAIFMDMTTFSHGGLQLRLTGKAALGFWRSFFLQGLDKVIFTSFGSPYMLYELPSISNLICVWGKEEVSQEAAVKAWFGEIPMEGKMPVRPQKCRIRRWEFND